MTQLTPCFVASDGTVCAFVMRTRKAPARYRLNAKHLMLFDQQGQSLGVPLTLPDLAQNALRSNPRLRVATCDAESPVGYYECEAWPA